MNSFGMVGFCTEIEEGKQKIQENCDDAKGLKREEIR